MKLRSHLGSVWFNEREGRGGILKEGRGRGREGRYFN
jgi:hypothetical protein